MQQATADFFHACFIFAFPRFSAFFAERRSARSAASMSALPPPVPAAQARREGAQASCRVRESR